jgi:hypothetical protein
LLVNGGVPESNLSDSPQRIKKIHGMRKSHLKSQRTWRRNQVGSTGIFNRNDSQTMCYWILFIAPTGGWGDTAQVFMQIWQGAKRFNPCIWQCNIIRSKVLLASDTTKNRQYKLSVFCCEGEMYFRRVQEQDFRSRLTGPDDALDTISSLPWR